MGRGLAWAKPVPGNQYTNMRFAWILAHKLCQVSSCVGSFWRPKYAQKRDSGLWQTGGRRQHAILS